MIRWLLRSRDYGAVITFLVVLAILFYVSNNLLSLVGGIRIPLIGARTSAQPVDLIDTLAGTTPQAVIAGTASAGSPAQGTTAAATPTPAVEIRRVGNTGGLGVFLRRTPNVNDWIRAWVDNSEMIRLGDEVEAGGFRWLKVRDPAGNEGWIPEQYLLPPR